MLRKKSGVSLDKLDFLAMTYHWLTEEHDQLRCRYRNHYGIAIPVTGDEAVDCCRNARRVLRWLADCPTLRFRLRRNISRTVLWFEEDWQSGRSFESLYGRPLERPPRLTMSD